MRRKFLFLMILGLFVPLNCTHYQKEGFFFQNA